jgi:DNA-binding NarL/FixJ family response regulator
VTNDLDGLANPPRAALASAVRVFLADDHQLVRSGLKALIDAETDLTVVGEAGDGLAALEGVAALLPDVVVMDLSMPRLGGTAATERILATCPGVKILALTAHDERGYLNPVLSAGAAGCMLKRAAAEDLVRAIRVVASGGVYLDPAMAGQVITNGRRSSSGPAKGTPQLSDREGEVLVLIAQGHAMKEIARKLTISTRTLETYRARAMEKLSLETRADIVQYVRQRGWFGDS